METQSLIQGIHHVTATVRGAQEDYHFYTQVLGMRLVKKTVNFDNNHVYHFYYADRMGTPGTIFTTFPYEGQPNVKTGVEGNGLIITTALSVPVAALSFWEDRLRAQGVLTTHGMRFGQPYIWFREPASLQIELIGDDQDDREPWRNPVLIDFPVSDPNGQFPKGVEIRGIHHVTLSIAPEHWEPMLDFLQAEMNMQLVGQEHNRVRMSVNGGGAGHYLELRNDPYMEKGKNGIGTVHHVAWKVSDDTALLALRERMIALGLNPTEVRDRKYFHSVYFRPVAGMWFEMATMAPGFAIDESEEALGQQLLLPEWEEVNRATIEAALPPIG
jgi:glyoxalase family protein